MADRAPEQWLIVDASQSIDAVHQTIRERVQALIKSDKQRRQKGDNTE
jgi:thymidylate kinase